MKTFIALLLLAWLASVTESSVAGESTPYDPNPSHPWNRLNETLFQRTAEDGKKYGLDELDILYWYRTTNLLVGASHDRAIAVLDHFIQTHADQTVRDPLKRAFLQRDLWQLFDWLAKPWSADPYATQRRNLESRLAVVIRRLALTTNEIASLPDNYALTDRHLAPDLPRGLFQTNGDWVSVSADPYANSEIAPLHDHNSSGHSAFLVFFKEPQGRSAALAYLNQLRSSERFWIYVTNNSPFVTTNDPHEILTLNTNLPEFPANTRWALARRLLLIDSNGNLQPTHIIESIQMRRYVSLSPPKMLLATNESGGVSLEPVPAQDFYEFQMDRRQNGALREIAAGEKDFLFVHFLSKGIDPFEEELNESTVRDSATFKGTVLESCRTCHAATGIYSVNVYAGLFHPRTIDTPVLWESDINLPTHAAMNWKLEQYSWGLLQGLWNQSN